MAALWPLMERTAMHIENMVYMDEYTSKTMLVTNTASTKTEKQMINNGLVNIFPPSSF